MHWKTKLCNKKWRKLWLLLLEQQKNDRSSLFSLSKLTGLPFRRKFLRRTNGSFTEEKDKAGSAKGINLGMWKSIYYVNRIQAAGLNSQINRMHDQYSPLWKCSKLFIPPQTDGMIRFCFNIGCSKSKVIFKWRRTKTTHKGKKAFREANVHTLCISFSLSQNSLSDKQTQSNTVNTQKSPPWACDKRCAEACAERFSALKLSPSLLASRR